MIKKIKEILPKSFKKNLRNILNKERSIKRKFIWLDEYNQKIKLNNKGVFLSKAPSFGHNTAEQLINYPEVYAYNFSNIIGSIGSSSFYTKETAYIERFQGIDQSIARYNSGHLIRHDNNYAYFKKQKKIKIKDRVLFLGGNGSFNYFHWLIEILPKLCLINETMINTYNIDYIIVNNIIKENKNLQDSLDYLNTKLKFKILYVSENKIIQFKNMVYLTTTNHVLYNSMNNESKINYNYFSKNLLEKFRNSIFSKQKNYDFSKKEFPKKIFLLRGNVNAFNRRSYNELEVLEYFKSYGYIGIKTEELSFLEQVYLFSNATDIAGPSGAFWANIIFCTKGANAFSWLPEELSEFSVYSSLAYMFDVKMEFSNCIHKKDTNLHGPYLINMIKMKNDFKNIIK